MSVKLSVVLARKDALNSEYYAGAKKIYELASGQDKTVEYNILYANTEILTPALYSQTPTVEIKKRHEKRTKVMDGVILALSRMAEFCLDSNIPNAPSFSTSVLNTVRDSLLGGQGISRVRFKKVPYPCIYLEHVAYDSFIWDAAPTWDKVQWIAFKHVFTLSQAKTEFAEELQKNPDSLKALEAAATDETDSNRQTVELYEVWDKTTKIVRFLLERGDISGDDLSLRTLEDPFQLPEFWPCCAPLAHIFRPDSLTPVALYEFYRKQAEELNRITARLNHIIAAVKIRGTYDPQFAELRNIFEDTSSENKLFPAKAGSISVAPGGIDKAIWLVPIDKFITVARELQAARRDIQSVIYQITGLSDIVRGSSAASETATAQEIKSKWGGLRLATMQTSVAAYVRDNIRLMLDVAGKAMGEEDWANITALPFLSTVQIQAAGGNPSQEDAWPEVLAWIRGGLWLKYSLDLETNSTLAEQAVMEKQELAEFMQSFAQLSQAMTSLSQLGQGGDTAGKLLAAEVVKRFRLSPQLVAALEAITPVEIPPQIQQAQEQLQQQGAMLQEESAKLRETKAAVEKEQAMSKDRFRAEQLSFQERVSREQLALVEERAALDGAKADFVLEQARWETSIAAHDAKFQAPRKEAAQARVQTDTLQGTAQRVLAVEQTLAGLSASLKDSLIAIADNLDTLTAKVDSLAPPDVITSNEPPPAEVPPLP